MTESGTTLPDTLRLRLERIATTGPYGGLPVSGIMTPGDQALIDRGLVELMGDTLHLTMAGASLVRGSAA